MNSFAVSCLLFATACVGQEYDLLLQGGHVIDPKSKTDALRDVGIRDGKIAVVESSITGARARETINVSGLYVTPGLVDIHAHVYAWNSVYPDGAFGSGVTTVADAGSAGWKNYKEFENRVLKRSRTRILVFLNIVGNGMRGPRFEDDLNDMDADMTARAALEHKDRVVGIKCAHYAGPEWTPVERAVQAGMKANIPVMIDFGVNHPESRPLSQLLMQKLRPGDIYTHAYSGFRGEMDAGGKPGAGMLEGRQRGVMFDVGHGARSFRFSVAGPLTKAGFWPDSISSDLQKASMDGGMNDMLSVASKFLALGMPLPDVVAASTWNPAREIKHEELGSLSVGAPADVAVLRLDDGDFGFVDCSGALLRAKQRLLCEITLRDGKVVYKRSGKQTRVRE